MAKTLLECPDLYQDSQVLLAADRLFARAYTQNGPNRPWKKVPCTFEHFADTIVSQQLSLKAAATIYGRLEGLLGKVTPEAVLAAVPQDIRACGLSGQKVKYLLGLAEAVVAGEFLPHNLPAMTDEAVYKAVTALAGFGVWSAQMVLIFALARRDVFPSGDLGVLEGMRLLRNLPARPTPAEAQRYAARKWKGRQTAAALLLWELKDRSKNKTAAN